MRTVAIAFIVAAVATSVAIAGDACNNTNDLLVFKREWTTFHEKMETCATKCLAARSCTQACIKKSLSLTDACCSCFTDDVICTAGKCMRECTFGKVSQACLDCHHEKCYPALLPCVGVDESLIPK